jgi:hypothetical protein
VAAGLPPMLHPSHNRHPQMMTRPAAREPPHRPCSPRGRPAPCEPPPRPLRPSTEQESSTAPDRATPQETAPIAAERPLCLANKNITYVK